MSAGSQDIAAVDTGAATTRPGSTAGAASRHRDAGDTLVELVAAAALLFIIATVAMEGFLVVIGSGAGSSMRAQAIGLANQSIEQARNLPYDSVGTRAGFPAGTIPDVAVVGNFTVTTVVVWASDSTGLGPAKTITVTVSWTTGQPGSVVVQSDIAGTSQILNTGDVTILVVDADTARPIQGITVQIATAAGTGTSKSTDSSGSVVWSQIPSGRLTISSSAAGYVFDLSQVATATVVANQMNTWTLTAARASSGSVTVLDASSRLLSGVSVSMTGPSGTLSAVTNNGTATFPSLLKGTYAVTASLAGYVTGTGTLGVLASGQQYSTSLTLRQASTLNLLVKDTSGAALSGVTLAVTPAGATGPLATDSSGAAAFTVTGTGPYTVTCTKTNYFTASGVTGSIPSGGTVGLTVTMSAITTGTINVTYTSTASSGSPKSVYIYNASHAIASTLSFTSKNQVLPVVLSAGQYYASAHNSWPGTSTVAAVPYLNVNTTVAVSVSSTN